ncbi:hypothetical protein [Rubricoccus marinus]|uniref:Uncharacterized protein n=1 Tax=Rubricoccus marinus TaxID=716817 RepID=A0A259TV34_9BACT|nr:hypothetical protein [Rubricoccus marinus]OZC01408.1 hypothetical protein BSZ36_17125 [Rubricoccus marinus]
MTDRPASERLDLPTEDYDALALAIASDQSPVGIDAKKTHVVILHLLLDLQDRLARLEARLDAHD